VSDTCLAQVGHDAGAREELVLGSSAVETLEGADALVVITWKQFRSPDFARLKAALADGVVVDGHNLHEPEEVEAARLAYYGIGRGRSYADVIAPS
jgi:UDPglucose 6-dehydrogenase